MGHGSASHSSEHRVEDQQTHLGHIVPVKTYWQVFTALLILTAITVGAAQIDFGAMNLVVAMLIASVKAGLVFTFFMHLKFEERTIWLYVGFPIFLLGLLIAGVFLDNPFRTQTKHVTTIVEQPIKAEGAGHHE